MLSKHSFFLTDSFFFSCGIRERASFPGYCKKSPQLQELKKKKWILSQFPEARNLKWRCWQGRSLSKISRESPSSLVLSGWFQSFCAGSRQFLACGGITDICLLMALFSMSFLFLESHHRRTWDPPHFRMIRHLKILGLITSTKPLFPNKVTLTGWTYLLGVGLPLNLLQMINQNFPLLMIKMQE